MKTSKPCDTELDSEQKAEWEEKIRNAQEYADTARRESDRLLVISGTAVQPYRYSSAVHARGGRD